MSIARDNFFKDAKSTNKDPTYTLMFCRKDNESLLKEKVNFIHIQEALWLNQYLKFRYEEMELRCQEKIKATPPGKDRDGYESRLKETQESIQRANETIGKIREELKNKELEITKLIV